MKKENLKDKAFKKIREKILELMKTEGSDWTKPWIGSGAPVNYLSQKEYRGINYFWLAIQGFSSNEWGTFKQWNSKGYKIKKGSVGTEIIFAQRKEKNVDWLNDGEKEQYRKTGVLPKYFLWRAFKVFNADQVEGYTSTKNNTDHSVELTEEKVKFIQQYILNTGAVIKNAGSAYFSPAQDYIGIPEVSAFNTDVAYSSTLLHELTHWTGSEKRLKRDFSGGFGSVEYSKEELVAEIGSAFLSAQLGVEKTVREDHAQYLNNWISIISDSEKAMISAFSKAQKAVDFLNKLQEQEVKDKAA